VEFGEQNQLLQVKLTELEFENSSFKNRFDFQSKNLLEKSSEISQLEASNMQKQSTISDIQHELKKTKERLSHLEEERKLIENQSLTMNDRNTMLINSLQSQLSQLNSEKATQQQEFNEIIQTINLKHADQMSKIKSDFQYEREQITSEFESKMSNEQASFKEKLLTLELNLNKTFKAENQKLLHEKNELKEQLDRIYNEFKNKSGNYEADLKKTLDLLEKAESSVNDLTNRNQQLLQLKDQFEKECTQAHQISHQQVAQIGHLTNELEQLKFLHESTTKDSQLELKVKLEMLNKDLNSRWQEKLKTELDNLRKELNATMEAEKRDEIQMLNTLKDQELKSLKTVWQTKTNELLEEVSLLIL
jgi:hypothetical protein